MELKWLEDFICIAHTGSFSKAASSRNITQSAFSRRIMALEQWLGTTLINRTSHPITLTAEGSRFVETAEQSVRLFHKVRSDFNEDKRNKRRSLTIGIADHLAIHFFPSWLNSIRPLCSDYYFDLLSSIRSGARFFESLRFQEYDFLICYSGAINATVSNSANFASIKLGQESLLPVCNTSLLARERYCLHNTEDKPLPYISYKPYSLLARAVAELSTFSDVAPIHLETVIETSSAESIKSLVMEGYGIAWLPKSAIKDELNGGAATVIGDRRYHIPLTIEIHRYIPNTKPDIMSFWEQLSACYNKDTNDQTALMSHFDNSFAAS